MYEPFSAGDESIGAAVVIPDRATPLGRRTVVYPCRNKANRYGLLCTSVIHHSRLQCMPWYVVVFDQLPCATHMSPQLLQSDSEMTVSPVQPSLIARRPQAQSVEIHPP